jgi:hypothetical protein
MAGGLAELRQGMGIVAAKQIRKFNLLSLQNP